MRKSQPNIQNLFTHTADGARILQAFREARLQPTSKQPGATIMQLEMRKANYDRFLKLIRTGGWQALPPIILDLQRMAIAQGMSLREAGQIAQGTKITVIITDTTHITRPRFVLELPVAETRNSSVYVAIFTPNNGNAPFVYGVFRSEEFAQEHWQQHGDKEGTLRVTHETLLERRGDWVSGTVKGEPNRMRHPQRDQIPKEEHENTFQHWQQPTYTSGKPRTVGELKRLLAQYGDDEPMYVHTGDEFRVAALDAFEIERGVAFDGLSGKQLKIETTGEKQPSRGQPHTAVIINPL